MPPHIVQLTVRPGKESDQGDPAAVNLEPTEIPDTEDQPLWDIIQVSSEALSFERYEQFMDDLVSESQPGERGRPSLLCLAIALLAFIIGVLIGALVA